MKTVPLITYPKPQAMNTSKKYDIILLIGPPTSGKSTWAKKMAAKYGYKILSMDTCMTIVNGKYHKYNPVTESKVSEVFNTTLRSMYRDRQPVIIDNCHHRINYIREVLADCPINYTIGIKIFDVSYRKFLYRNIKRGLLLGKWIPRSVFKRMRKQCQNVYHRVLPGYMRQNRHLKIEIFI